MRLLRLEGEGLGGRAIDLHPEISVLTDLDPDLRARVLRACRALPGGDDPGCAGLVEAHGVLFDLTPATLALLGLDRPLDVLLPLEQDEGEPEQKPIEVLEAAVARMRAERAELDRAQLDLLGDLEQVRKRLDPFARTAYEQARIGADRQAGLSEVEAMLAELEDPGPIEERLAAIGRIDRELAEVDRDAVAAALEQVRSHDGRSDPLAAEAGRLAVELRQLDTELADLDTVLAQEGRHPLEVGRRRDALSVEVARLESEHAPRTVDQPDREALEEAHDEVMAAQARVGGSLLGGRSAERRLEEAVQAEEEILERIGLPTYSAYVMAITVGAVDPQLEQRLHEARLELAACQTEYEEATALLEHDPTRTTLCYRQEEIVARATELLGRDPGPDVVGQLLAFKSEREGADPTDDLRHVLEREGLLVPGLELDDQEVTDIAAAWLAEMLEAAEAAEDRGAEAEELQARLAEIARVRAEADERRRAAEDNEKPDELLAAEARLETHEAAAERVATMTALLEDVDERRHALDAGIEAQDAVAELIRLGVDGAEAEAGGLELLEERRRLVRTRLHEHRDRSFAGSVPLLVSGLFTDLDRERASTLLGMIEEEAGGVQVVILDEDLAVASWATSVGIERAAVVSPE